MPDTLDRIEPERYELTAQPAYRFAVDRRDFLGLLGGGLLIVFSARAQESGRISTPGSTSAKTAPSPSTPARPKSARISALPSARPPLRNCTAPSAPSSW
jgi:hypothetical protein